METVTMEIIESEQFKRTNIRFSGKPSEEVLNNLKEAGWFYNKTTNVWFPKTKEAAEVSKDFALKLNETYFEPTANKNQYESLIFNEQGTGNYLKVESTNAENVYQYSLYNQGFSLLERNQINLSDINSGIDGLTVAADFAFEHTKTNKLDVMILSEEEFSEEMKNKMSAGNAMLVNLIQDVTNYELDDSKVLQMAESIKSQIIKEYDEQKKKTELMEKKYLQLSQVYDNLLKAHEEDLKKIQQYEKLNSPSYVIPFLNEVNPVMDEVALKNKQNGEYIIISRSSEKENEWHYTNYNSDYSEIDGGVFEADEENGWNIREAVKQVLNSVYPDVDYPEFEHISIVETENQIEAAEKRAEALKALEKESDVLKSADSIHEMESDDVPESIIALANQYSTSVNQAKKKFGNIITETFLRSSNEEIENNITLEQKQKTYNTLYRSMVDEINEAISRKDEDVIKLIQDFDLNKEKHVGNNRWYSAEESFMHDVRQKLLPELYEKIQTKIRKQYDEQKVPYVVMYSSESPRFPSENKVYSVKEFNELLLQADSDFYNRKKYAEQKYGSADNYWDLERDDKLPEEDNGIQFGYDKTNFKFFNIPNPNNPEDTFSYEPSRYDIGDGNGSIFDYVRATCSHDEFIEALNALETQLYFPNLDNNHKQIIDNFVSEEKKVLSEKLQEAMKELDEAQSEYKELHKKWLIEASEADRVDNKLKAAVDNIHQVYEDSVNNIYDNVFENIPPTDRSLSLETSTTLRYMSNEAKKLCIESLYQPSRDAQKAMNAEDYKTYNSVDWAKLRRIWEQFPANVNMSNWTNTLLEGKIKDLGIELESQVEKTPAQTVTEEEREAGINAAKAVRAENARKQYEAEQGSNYDSSLSTTDIAKNLRNYIKQQYPGYKFSVRSEYFAGGSSIRVELKKTPVEIATFDTMKEYCEKHPSTERYNYEKQKYEKYYELTPEERIGFVNKILENSSFYNINDYHFESMDYMNPEVKAVVTDVIQHLESYNYDHSDIQTDYFDVNFYSHYSISSEAVEHSLEIIANKAAGITEEKPVKEEIGSATKAEIVMNKKHNIPNLSFDGKPDEEMRDKLKAEGWLWNGKDGVWWPRTNEAQANAQKFAEGVVNSYLNIEIQNIKSVSNQKEFNELVWNYGGSGTKIFDDYQLTEEQKEIVSLAWSEYENNGINVTEEKADKIINSYFNSFNKNINNKEVSQKDIEICKKVIPPIQFKLTQEMLSGEEKKHFENILIRTAEMYRNIYTEKEIINSNGTHPLGFHYFIAGTDIYVSEINKEGVCFGYTVLNGDTQMAEFGYTYLNEILSIPYVEMDYYLNENTTIEQELYKKYPDAYPEYSPENLAKLPVLNSADIDEVIEADISISEEETKKTQEMKYDMAEDFKELSKKEFLERYPSITSENYNEKVSGLLETAKVKNLNEQPVYVYEHGGYAAHIAHGVKENDEFSLDIMAESLAETISHSNYKDIVIVPVPQHTGNAEYTLELAKRVKLNIDNLNDLKETFLGEIPDKFIEIKDILKCEPHETLYSQKKEIQNIKGYYSPEEINNFNPGKMYLTEELNTDKTVLLLDNVISTGKTIEAVQQLIPEAKPLVFAVSNSYKTKENKVKKEKSLDQAPENKKSKKHTNDIER